MNGEEKERGSKQRNSEAESMDAVCRGFRYVCATLEDICFD